MTITLDKSERDMLVNELEENAIPEIRVLIASGMRKDLRDELKQDEAALKILLQKLKTAA